MFQWRFVRDLGSVLQKYVSMILELRYQALTDLQRIGISSIRHFTSSSEEKKWSAADLDFFCFVFHIK